MRLPALFFSHEVHTLTLQRELLAMGLRSIKPAFSLLLASLLALSGIGILPAQVLVIWLCAALTSTLIGLRFKHRYAPLDYNALSVRQIRHIEWEGVFYGAATGIVWGSSSWLLLPQGNPEYNLIIITVYLGVCAGAGSLSIFGLGHLLLASAIGLILFVARFPVMFPQHWMELMVMFTLYHLVIVRMAWERNRMMIANLLLREEKEDLLVLQRAESARAQQANHEKSAFLAAASHDLRQPVHALMLTSHTLRMQLPEGDSRMLVDRILESGHALSEQFNNLMDLSRLESGAYQPSFSTVSLGDLLRRVCAAHRQVAESAGIGLTLRVDRRLQQQFVSTDAGLLGRCIDNLVDNAIKFSERGSRVLLSVRLLSGNIRIAVHDQGIGIAPEQQENIFKPYVQLNNPARDRAKGIGLGLSIVHEAAARIGARLVAHSQYGRGSCFMLELVAADCSVAPGVVQASVAASASGLKKLQGRKLLLVEDDPMAAAALQTWAASLGLSVVHHADPASVNPAQAPDIILCDIRLPGERDGISWLTEWLGRWPDARGLLLSGELLPETHQSAEQEGLLLLSKPVNPDVLLQTLVGLAR